ncbi:MAG: hypothetical protein NC452_03660 [Eubacterium sp.]|nr:hypothetical protein [Eubacterium sp.]
MLFEYLRNTYPNCVLACALTDIVDSYIKFKDFNIDELTSTFDVVCTYNAIDAQKYGFSLAPSRLYNFEWVRSDEDIPESDVFFVGLNKNRLDKLLKVYEICTQKGLKCDFYISDVGNDKMKYADKIVYNKRISYEEVLKRCKKTKCIVNLIQTGAEGITLRDQEAIGMNKCLITDNPAILDSDFYTREKVIWFDNIETEIDKVFSHSENINWNGTDKHSALSYYQWLEDMIDKIKHTEEH